MLASSLVVTWALVATSPLPLVAVDAGHGGEHDGALGICGAKEKDLTLAISVELARLLEASERARVLLVRTDDETLELAERSVRANSAKAQLLVSIHANSGSKPEHHGVETFFLSRGAADKRALQVAKRENGGVLPAEQATTSTLDSILAGLSLNAAHLESQRLAFKLQEALKTDLAARGRGVMQAPFIVLMGAEMASALVEVGFMTNPEECTNLANADHQSKVAQALARAILAHLASEHELLARNDAGPAGSTR